MELKVLNQTKDELEMQVDNLTIVELLRSYLNQDSSVEFAAWKREHPTENPILKVKAKDAKKAINDAITKITKELDTVSKDFQNYNNPY